MILIRPPAPIQAPSIAGVELHPPAPANTVALGRLYFEAYEPGVASGTLEEAIDDIRLTFDGSYGVLDLGLSRLAWRDEQLVGASLVVERAPWPDTPDCPFVIELFTARTHRRQGLAHLLLTPCATTTVALRVEEKNHPAMTLYRSLGFQEG